MRLRFLAGVAVALLLQACGREPEIPPSPPPKLPPLGDFPIAGASDVEADTHQEIPSRKAGPLAWNFREGAHFAYLYRQETSVDADLQEGRKGARVTTRTRHDGMVEIVGGGNDRAELRYKRTLREQTVNDLPVTAEQLNAEKPLLFVSAIRSDGTFLSTKRKSGSTDLHLLDLFLALPRRDLAPGDVDQREIHLPGGATEYSYHGTLRLRHGGWRKAVRWECVRLEVDADLEVSPPEPYQGSGRLKGRIIAYFDPENGRFVSIRGALAQVTQTQAQIVDPEGQEPPTWNRARLATDTKVEMELKEE